jgi:hypothetical protein
MAAKAAAAWREMKMKINETTSAQKRNGENQSKKAKKHQ